jgi:putative nucleotidyltransferase with HDIG domain
MTTLTLNQITRNIKDLPTLPAVVMELLNTIDKEDANFHQIAEKVSHDIALTAKTLHYANSAFYSTMIKVTSIQQAINLLGTQAVKQIIMTAALSGCFPENNCKGFDHKSFWRHSNAVAITAKILARRTNVNPDLAYTAALLHDIGVLVLVSQFPDIYSEAIAYRYEHEVSQLLAERKILGIGIDHAVVGELLAEQWNFSDVMRKTIAGHHAPDTPGLGFLASIIHVADGIAHYLSISTTRDTEPPEVSAVAWESLELNAEAFEEILAEAKAEFEKLNKTAAL